MEDEKGIKEEGMACVEKVKSILIRNNEEYQNAGEFLKEVRVRQDKIYEIFDSIIDKAHKAHKEAITKRDVCLEPWETAEKALKRIMVDFSLEEERKRLTEEIRITELNRKEAEKLEKKADKAEGQGNGAKAEELRGKAQEIEAIAPIVQSTVSKIDGIKKMKIWKFTITDEALLPREYLIPDTKKIGAMAKASKGTITIPGVKIYSEETLAL